MQYARVFRSNRYIICHVVGPSSEEISSITSLCPFSLPLSAHPLLRRASYNLPSTFYTTALIPQPP